MQIWRGRGTYPVSSSDVYPQLSLYCPASGTPLITPATDAIWSFRTHSGAFPCVASAPPLSAFSDFSSLVDTNRTELARQYVLSLNGFALNRRSTDSATPITSIQIGGYASASGPGGVGVGSILFGARAVDQNGDELAAARRPLVTITGDAFTMSGSFISNDVGRQFMVEGVPNLMAGNGVWVAGPNLITAVGGGVATIQSKYPPLSPCVGNHRIRFTSGANPSPSSVVLLSSGFIVGASSPIWVYYVSCFSLLAPTIVDADYLVLEIGFFNSLLPPRDPSLSPPAPTSRTVTMRFGAPTIQVATDDVGVNHGWSVGGAINYGPSTPITIARM